MATIPGGEQIQRLAPATPAAARPVDSGSREVAAAQVELGEAALSLGETFKDASDSRDALGALTEARRKLADFDDGIRREPGLGRDHVAEFEVSADGIDADIKSRLGGRAYRMFSDKFASERQSFRTSTQTFNRGRIIKEGTDKYNGAITDFSTQLASKEVYRNAKKFRDTLALAAARTDVAVEGGFLLPEEGEAKSHAIKVLAVIQAAAAEVAGSEDPVAAFAELLKGKTGIAHLDAEIKLLTVKEREQLENVANDYRKEQVTEFEKQEATKTDITNQVSANALREATDTVKSPAVYNSPEKWNAALRSYTKHNDTLVERKQLDRADRDVRNLDAEATLVRHAMQSIIEKNGGTAEALRQMEDALNGKGSTGSAVLDQILARKKGPMTDDAKLGIIKMLGAKFNPEIQQDVRDLGNELANISARVTFENLDETLLAGSAAVKRVFQEPKKQERAIREFGNQIGQTIYDTTIKDSAEEAVKLLSDRAFLKLLSPKQITTMEKETSKLLGVAGKAKADKAVMEFVNGNSVTWARINGETEVQVPDGKGGTKTQQIQPMGIDEMNTIIARTRANGGGARDIQILNNLRAKLLRRVHGESSTSQTRRVPGIFLQLAEEISNSVSTVTQTRKGKRKITVTHDPDITLTKLYDIQERVYLAQSRDEINANDVKTLLNRLAKPLASMVEKETGVPAFLGVGGGPNDEFDVGYQKLIDMMKVNGHEDNVFLKDKLFQTFVTEWERGNYENERDPVKIVEAQQSLALKVANAYAKELGVKAEFTADTLPNRIRLITGQVVTIGDAALFNNDRTFQQSLGRDELEAREVTVDGKAFTSFVIKGTDIEVGRR